MLVTVKVAKGVGLAAPQVGVSKRLFIVSPSGKQRYPHCNVDDTLIVINPEIKILSQKTHVDYEGCLSIPGIRGKVSRPIKIEVTYLNRLGEQHTEVYEDFTARIFLHENDHLNGTVFLDLMENNKSIITDNEYMKLFD